METTATDRGVDLARRLEESSERLIAAVAACDEAGWHAPCPDEGRSVGVMVHHIASSIPLVAGWAEQLATGGGLPELTMAEVDAQNAAHAGEHAACTKEEALDLLRRNTTAAADRIRGLSDEQLDRAAPFAIFGGRPVSAQGLLEIVLIGHVDGYPHSHLPKIATALTRP